MRKVLILLAFLMICNLCYGEVYMLVDKETDDVVSMSPWDDAVMEKSQEKIVLPGELIDYPLQYHPIYYKYVDGRFVVNIKKMSDEALEKEKLIKEQQEKEKKIKEKLNLSDEEWQILKDILK